MWPYILCSIFTLFFSYIADKTFHKQPVISWVMLIMLVVNMTVWLGLRDFGIGIDTTIYVEDYFLKGSSMNSFLDIFSLNDYNYGYLLIAFIASKFGSDAQNLLISTELFIITLTVISAYRYKKLISMSIMTFMFFYSFIFVAHSINLMRQYCAISILLLSFSYMIEKKWIHFILLFVISYFFHSSAIYFLAIPAFYFITRIKNSITRNLLVVLSCIVLYVVYNYFFIVLQMLGAMNVVPELYTERYDASSYGTLNGVSMILFASQLFTVFFIYLAYSKKVINLHIYNFILLMYLFYLFTCQLGYVSHYMERLAHYVYIIFIVFLSYLFGSKRIDFIYKLIIVMFCVYFWWKLVVFYNGGEIYPYTSKILGI